MSLSAACTQLRKLEALERRQSKAASKLHDRIEKQKRKVAAAMESLKARQELAARKFFEAQARDLSCSKRKKPKKKATKKKTTKLAGTTIRRKWPDLLTPAGRFSVRLRVVPIDDVITSHDPITWRKDPRYPPNTQERRYETDFTEQQKVRKIAHELDPQVLLATTPTAIDGPPVVAVHPSGQLVALGGNARTMGLKQAFGANKGTEYTDELARLTGKRKPNSILVRELVPSPHTDEWPRWSRLLNRGLQGGKSMTTDAVSLSRSLPPRVFELLAGKKLAPALRTRTGREVLEVLQRAGLVGAGERALFEEDGLSEQGRALVARAIAGAVLGDADLLEQLPPATAGQIGRAGANLLNAREIGGAPFDLIPTIRAAARDFADASSWHAGVKDWTEARHLIEPETLKFGHGEEVIRALVNEKIEPFAKYWNALARARPANQNLLFPDGRTMRELAASALAAVKS